MKTLGEAWAWYESAKRNLERMKRLGVKHWKDPSLRDASIWLDDRFKMVEAGEIESETSIALRPIEDLAVLLLFSVFEATVRDHLQVIIQPEADALIQPILKNAAADAIEGVHQGSSSLCVLKPLQAQGLDAELIEQINQIRDYRNWVAHGKRTRRKKEIANVSAKQAFDRLSEFLDRLGIAVEPEVGHDNEIERKPDGTE